MNILYHLHNLCVPRFCFDPSFCRVAAAFVARFTAMRMRTITVRPLRMRCIWRRRITPTRMMILKYSSVRQNILAGLGRLGSVKNKSICFVGRQTSNIMPIITYLIVS